ncbi:MAG: hypothetical protein AB1742_04805 [bacterium]
MRRVIVFLLFAAVIPAYVSHADFYKGVKPLCSWRSEPPECPDCQAGGQPNYSRDHPMGGGVPALLSELDIIRDYPFPGEYVTLRFKASRGDPTTIDAEAIRLLWAEAAYSINGGTQWYANSTDGATVGRGVPMDYFTEERLDVDAVGGMMFKQYKSAVRPWGVSHVSAAWVSGDPSPNRRGTADGTWLINGVAYPTFCASGGAPTPCRYDEPWPWGLNGPLYDTWPANDGSPTYTPWDVLTGGPSCADPDGDCNVPGFPEGGGDMLDSFPTIDPYPGTDFPNIPGEPLVRVNGVPAIACDVWIGASNPNWPAAPEHPLCTGTATADEKKLYEAFGIKTYKLNPPQGKVKFSSALKSSDVVDAVFYTTDKKTRYFTGRMDMTKAPFSTVSFVGGQIEFYPRVYDTCGNVASGGRARAPIFPTFPPTNEAVTYVMAGDDYNYDNVPNDTDPFIAIMADDVNTECGGGGWATDDFCPESPPEGWTITPAAFAECQNRPNCECCYNECDPTFCPHVDNGGTYPNAPGTGCWPVGDAANPPGCGPEFDGESGMLELEYFKVSHSASNLYLKIKTTGTIQWGCYGSWYPIVGCEPCIPFITCDATNGDSSTSKFNAYSFQIVNVRTVGTYYLMVIPSIEGLYGPITIFIDLPTLMEGLGSNPDGSPQEERYADGTGCTPPGQEEPGNPCVELCGLEDPAAEDPGGDCDGDGWTNATDACPCSAADPAESTDGCPPEEPGEDFDKYMCPACAIEQQDDEMWIEMGLDATVGDPGYDPFTTFAFTLGIHLNELDFDWIIYKACLVNYSLEALGTDRTPAVNYYLKGPMSQSTVEIRNDTVPPEAPPVLRACLGRCPEAPPEVDPNYALSTDGLDNDGDSLRPLMEPDASYHVDEGYDPTARVIELQWDESLFNVDAINSGLTDLAGYKVYMSRGPRTAFSHYYTMCSPADDPTCSAMTSMTATDAFLAVGVPIASSTNMQRDVPGSDDELIQSDGITRTRFPKPFDPERADDNYRFNYPGETVSCIIDTDCDIVGNNFDDDKDDLVDDGCLAGAPEEDDEPTPNPPRYNCRNDYDSVLMTGPKLAEDGQEYWFRVLAYDTTSLGNHNHSAFSSIATVRILRNTTPPAPPTVQDTVYSMEKGRSIKLVWKLNEEKDMGGYAIYRCPARPADAVRKTEDGTLAAFCADGNNYRRINEDVLPKLTVYYVDEGLGYYESGDEDNDGAPDEEWFDCANVDPANDDLYFCGNMGDGWATGSGVLSLYTATDTTRPVLFYNGLVDGYQYYYRVRAVDSPYRGDGTNDPGTCNQGTNPYTYATKQGCVNPINDHLDPLDPPLLTGRQCADPTVKSDWENGGNCSDYSNTVTGIPSDVRPPPQPTGVKAAINEDGTSVTLTWNAHPTTVQCVDLGTGASVCARGRCLVDPAAEGCTCASNADCTYEATTDYFQVFRATKGDGVFACVRGNCLTTPKRDGCECTADADCATGRECVYPVKICTTPDFTITQKPVSCPADGCMCSSDADCNTGAGRVCDYPFRVCGIDADTDGVNDMAAGDLRDNDGDGAIDEELAGDGIDNDQDGLIDEDTSADIASAGRCPLDDATRTQFIPSFTYTDTELKTDRTYYYKIAGVDNAVFDDPGNANTVPNISQRSETVVATPRDTQAPLEIPTGTCLDGGTPEPCAAVRDDVPPSDYTGNSLTVSWTANTSDEDILGYYVYRAEDPTGAGQPSLSQFSRITDSYVAQPTATGTVYYKDTGVENEKRYYYAVTALDTHYNQTGFSEITGPAIPKDYTPPSAPGWKAAYSDNANCSNPCTPPGCVCDTVVSHTCDDGGAAPYGGGGALKITWAPNEETVCYPKSANEVDIAGYNLYRSDDASCDTTANQNCVPGSDCLIAQGATQTVYIDENVTNGATYYYCVSAVDKYGNESAVSAVRFGTPVDAVAPGVPQGLVATPLAGTKVGLGWEKGSDADLAGYVIYRSTSTTEGSFARIDIDDAAPGRVVVNGIEAIDGTSYTDAAGLITGVTYYYKLTAIDSVGNESRFSDVASVVPRDTDTTAPTSVSKMYGRPGFDAGESPNVVDVDDDGDGFIDDTLVPDKAVEVYWNTIKDPDLDSYNLYRLDPQGISGCTCDTAGDPGGDCDHDGYPNATDSCPCTPHSANTSPFGSYKLIKTLTRTVACPASAHVRPAGTLSENTCYFRDNNDGAGLCNGSLYWYYVTGVDSTGNEGEIDATNALPATPNERTDTTAPDKPAKPLIYATPNGGSLTVKFKENDSSVAKNQDIAGYIVHRDTNLNGDYATQFVIYVQNMNHCDKANEAPCYCDVTDAAYACHLDVSVENGKRYFYKVSAFDDNGNQSGLSDVAVGTPKDEQSPSDAGGLLVQPTTDDANSLVITWSSHSVQQDPTFAGFRLYRASEQDGAFNVIDPDTTTAAVELIRGSSYVDGNLVAGQTYCYKLETVDTEGRASGGVIACGIPGEDITPPQAPSGLVAIPGQNSVSLDWNASSSPDLAGYNVCRALSFDGPFTKVNTSSVVTYPSYTDTGLNNGTIYWYYVTAYDRNYDPAVDAACDEANRDQNDSLPSKKVSVTPGTQSFQRSTQRGWNLVTVPAGAGRTAGRISTAVPSGDARIVYMTTGGYVQAVPGDGTALPAGQGFWIYTSEQDQMGYSGELNQSGDHIVSLVEGWNLVGNPFPVSIEWSDEHAFFSTGGGFAPLSQAVGAAGLVKGAWVYQSDGYAPVNPGDRIPPGTGFWIKVSQAAAMKFVR